MSAVDLESGYTLVFGGNGTAGYLGDTWDVKYDYSNSVYYGQFWANWSQVPTTASPSPRMAGAMAYDAYDGTVVLFGGYNGTYLGDTWVYTTGLWSEVRTAVTPAPRAYASMTWDNELNEIILFGGKNATQSFNDTWAYANGTWTQLHPSHAPSPRYGAAFAGDATAKFDLLFGGSNGSAQTWEFANGSWTEAAPTNSPPGRMYADLVYNGGDPELYLMGGYDGTALSDLWSWNAGNWGCDECSGTAPPARYGAIAADNPIGSDPIWATGSSGGNQTWIWTGTWTQLFQPNRPPPYAGADIAYDPITQQSVFEGGSLDGGYWTDSWALTGENWTDLNVNNPNNLYREEGTEVWDGADNMLLYFGGWDSAPLNDTWEFKGDGWFEVSTNHGPPARWDAAMAYDPAEGYVLLFGGSNNDAGTALFNDTWTYRAGVWTNITAEVGPAPPARLGAEMAWDGQDSEIVMFGGLGPQPLNDTWAFVGGHWTELHPPVAPPARYSGGFIYDSSTGEVYLSGGWNGNPLGDLWAFSAGVWTEISANAPFGPLDDVLSTYDTATHDVLVYGGNSPTGYSQETWIWNPSPSPLTVTATSNVSVVDGAVPIAFDATVSGGVPAYATTWTFGDGNSSSSLKTTHAYARPGTYPVRFYANDSTGVSVSVWLNVTENGRLAASPSATPTTVEVGVPVVFSAGVSGGTAPINISWDFGDGSMVAYGPAPRHIYESPQTYEVNVTVEDALGYALTAPVVVKVVTGPFFVGAEALPTVGTVPFSVDFNSTLHGGLPPYAVLWEFGDGNTSRLPDPVHNYTKAGTYEVKLYAADSSGDELTRYLNVTALTPAPLTVNPVEAPTSGGAPLTVNFTTGASGGSGTGYTYLWNFGDTSVGEGATLTHTYLEPGLYTPTLMVSDSAGDEATSTLSPITVTATTGSANLAVHAAAVPQPGISPTDVAFTASVIGGTPKYSFNWSFGDGATSVDPSPSHVYAKPGPYTVTLSVTDSSVPADSASTTLQVDVGAPSTGGLSISVAANPLNGSSPLTVSFAATASGGSGAYPDYQWAFGDGQTSTGPYASHVYTHPGIFTVHAYVVDSRGDNASVFLNVSVVTHAIDVTLQPSSTSGSAPLTVTFQASASGGTGIGFTYSWSFGDGTNGSGPDVVHTYAKVGNYTVTVTVVDSGKNVGSASLAIEVSPPPKPAATTSTATFLGLPVYSWYIIAPLIAVVAIMAGLLILVLRRPLLLATKTEEEEAPAPTGAPPPWPAGPLTMLETTQESAVYAMASDLPKDHLLVLTREAPQTLAESKALDASKIWQLSISEGENRVRPSDLEKMGNLVEQHLAEGPGRAVIITGVDLLLDATSLKSVRRLFAVSREVAEEREGRVLVALNPKSLSKENRVHIEEGATVVRY